MDKNIRNYINIILKQKTKIKKDKVLNLVLIIIPAAGVEPARCCHRWILSPVRLPIPPCWHISMITHIKYFVNFSIRYKVAALDNNFRQKLENFDRFYLYFSFRLYNMIVRLCKEVFYEFIII